LLPFSYLTAMRKTAFEPCIPTPGKQVPVGPNWIHEIKHDGYRLIVQREGSRVRLFTRNGNDWTARYPLIVEAALRNRQTSFVIDGEAVLLGVDGISDFNGLHSRRHDDEVQLYAFDILALGGDDLRGLPLHLRKTNLARLLARRPEGIFVSDFEQGEIGPDLFLQACKFGLEGLVSKRRDRPYRAGRSPDWVKVKNRSHPALERVKEAFSRATGGFN
jgi:bifunctional non-homologous end joining protein LigD